MVFKKGQKAWNKIIETKKIICQGCNENITTKINSKKIYCTRKCYYNNRSEQTKQKTRETNIRRGISPPIIYGRIPWNKDTTGLMKLNSGSFKKGERVSPKTEFKYTNGSGYRHLLYKGILKQECESCEYNEEIGRLQVHHKDKNRKNNNINNLQVLCRPCHLKKHNRVERKYVVGRKEWTSD